MMSSKFVFLAQAVSGFYLLGLIWTIQVVHYYLLNRIGLDHYQEYHEAHMRLITPIVAPVMIIELASALLLCLSPYRPVFYWYFPLILSLVLLIWASTFFIQVPIHSRLAQGFDAELYQRLVQTNWIRTFLWTLKAVIMLWLLEKVIKA